MTVLDNGEEEEPSHQRQPDEDERSMPPPPTPRNIDSAQFSEMSATRKGRAEEALPMRTKVTREYVDPVAVERERRIKKGKTKAVSPSISEQQVNAAIAKRDGRLDLAQVSRRRASDSALINQAGVAQEPLGPIGTDRKRKRKTSEANPDMIPLPPSKLQRAAAGTGRRDSMRRVVAPQKAPTVIRDQTIIDLTQDESGPESEAETELDDSLDDLDELDFIRVPNDTSDPTGAKLSDTDTNPFDHSPRMPPPPSAGHNDGSGSLLPPRLPKRLRRISTTPGRSWTKQTPVQEFLRGQYDAYLTRDDRVGGESNLFEL